MRDIFDELQTVRLTDDDTAEIMKRQIREGYTAPELVRERLVYIKLNQIEKRSNHNDKSKGN